MEKNGEGKEKIRWTEGEQPSEVQRATNSCFALRIAVSLARLARLLQLMRCARGKRALKTALPVRHYLRH
jgi:hypothetical protein